MPDIRFSPYYLDEFTRAAENPIVYSTTYPWRNGSYGPLFSDNTQLTGPTNYYHLGTGSGTCWSYWDGPVPQDETWARRAIGSYQFPFGSRQGFMTSSGEGYGYLQTGGFGQTMRRYTGGGAFTAIDASNVAGDGVFTDTECIQLLRLTASYVEIWRTVDPDDDETWALTGRWADTTYRSPGVTLYPFLGATGNEDGWTSLGGAELPTFLPGFIRRPWRYQGKPLETP